MSQPQTPPPPMPVRRGTSGYAIASLILSLAFCGIGSVLAIILGNRAKREIAASGGALGGEGMAKAGIVLGWIGIPVFIVYLVIVIITATS